jgi:iron complex outermembrane receptor protein
LFGWQFAEQWKLTLEGRYIYDKVKVSADTSDLAADILNPVPFNGPASYVYAGSPGFTDSIDDTNFVPRGSLEYLATDTVMLYGSIANGIKPPTYNTTDLGDPAIARVLKEKLWTYELGAKSTLSDGRLLLNGAVFLNDYTDQQVRVQFPPPAGSFTPRSGTANAADTTVWGVELDSSWRPTERWLLNLSYAYTDGEYDDLVLQDAQPPGAPVSRNEQVKAGNAAADYSGKDTVGNPNHAATFLGRYQAPFTPQYDWYGQTSVSYQGERYADIANLVELDAYTLVDAQLGLQGESWFVALFVDNVFDDGTIRYAQEFIDQGQGFQGTDPNSPPNTFTYPIAYFAYLPQPRTWGMRFSYSVN